MSTITQYRFDDHGEHINESFNPHVPPQHHDYVWSPHQIQIIQVILYNTEFIIPDAHHRILLTGANGYIASHILSQLLASGTNSARAVLRSLPKVDGVNSSFLDTPASQLDFAIVQGITISGAFDEALKCDIPFDIAMHTASPFLYSAASSARDFLELAIKGTTEILEGIQRVAKDTFKRVIITSSLT
jgi:nucleoside-diphosphate-sugar epimerase